MRRKNHHFLCNLSWVQTKICLAKTMHFLFKKLFSSSAIVLFSLIAFVHFCNTNAVLKPPGNATIPAIIAFGDSIMDTGNNNYIETVAKCNFPPYGRDFVGGKPTGRWSNGKAPTDLIGISLSLCICGLGIFPNGFVCFPTLFKLGQRHKY